MYVGRRGTYRFLMGRPEKRNHFEDLGADERIILKCIFKNLSEREPRSARTEAA
jgi:hypothetical protein